MLLDLSREIVARHEPAPKLRAERREAFWRIESERPIFERIFRDARALPIALSRLRGMLYAETSARLTFFAPAIAALMPEAKFVHLYRHPAAVIRSGMRRRWYAGHCDDRYRITPVCGSLTEHRWKSWTSFEKICWYWSACHDFAIHVMETLPPGRVLPVRSEELLNLGSGEWRRLFEFVGVRPPAADSVARLLSATHNAQQRGDFAEYEKWTIEHRRQMVTIAGNTMERLGLS